MNIGFSQILTHDSSLTPKQLEHVQTIARSGDHLLQLINDILDLSKIEAGKVNVQLTEFCLHDLLTDLRAMFLLLTSKKGLQFLFEWQPSIPKFVNADENKLRQIMINLLGNAVKFTAAGGIGARFRADKAVDVAWAASERLLYGFADAGDGWI